MGSIQREYSHNMRVGSILQILRNGANPSGFRPRRHLVRRSRPRPQARPPVPDPSTAEARPAAEARAPAELARGLSVRPCPRRSRQRRGLCCSGRGPCLPCSGRRWSGHPASRPSPFPFPTMPAAAAPIGCHGQSIHPEEEEGHFCNYFIFRNEKGESLTGGVH